MRRDWTLYEFKNGYTVYASIRGMTLSVHAERNEKAIFANDGRSVTDEMCAIFCAKIARRK